jgi:uncharacterized protein (DUF2252 family)
MAVTEILYALAVARGWTWEPLLALLVGACGAPTDDLARSQWLRQTLILDNQAFLDRDPEQAEGKLAAMGDGVYPWFRGTVAQYARDVMEPGGSGYQRSAYETADTRDVALVGDPHPENIGTFARPPELAITIEFNDFDAATFGPYDFDLRRLALSFWLAGEHVLRDAEDRPEPVPSLDPADRSAAARAVVLGYADEIASVAEDLRQGSVITEGEPAGVILTALAEDALRSGKAQDELADYTRVDDDRRSMFYGDVDEPRVLAYGRFSQQVFEDTVTSLDPREQALVEALLSRYAPTIVGDAPDAAALRLVGTSRRLGAGVSSYPALRYYALVEGPSTAAEDDVLLELKQALDAVPMPGLLRFPAQPFYANAERVATMQQRLQGAPDADPWLGWASAGADGYRVRWRTGYQRTLRVDALAEGLANGNFTAEDFVELAELAGRLLARSHGRARKQDGRLGAYAIADAIAGDDESLADEVVGFVEAYALQVLADHEAFVELLKTYGPHLGYVRR